MVMVAVPVSGCTHDGVPVVATPTSSKTVLTLKVLLMKAFPLPLSAMVCGAPPLTV